MYCIPIDIPQSLCEIDDELKAILPISLPRVATRVYFVIQNKLKESAKKKAV